jgi:ribosomal protein L32
MEEVQMTKKSHEKMLTNPGHKGNANQNHTNIPHHSCYYCYHQEHQQQQMLARIWGISSLYFFPL